MLRRCEDPRFATYRYYGGRGIAVCERWHDFEAFYADIKQLLGPCPPRMSMDRIDNDGNYEPGNVRWATADQQAQNRRGTKPRPEITSMDGRAINGSTVKALRKIIGISQNELAAKCGITKGELAGIERGVPGVSTSPGCRIAEALSAPLGAITRPVALEVTACP